MDRHPERTSIPWLKQERQNNLVLQQQFTRKTDPQKDPHVVYGIVFHGESEYGTPKDQIGKFWSEIGSFVNMVLYSPMLLIGVNLLKKVYKHTKTSKSHTGQRHTNNFNLHINTYSYTLSRFVQSADPGVT